MKNARWKISTIKRQVFVIRYLTNGARSSWYNSSLLYENSVPLTTRPLIPFYWQSDCCGRHNSRGTFSVVEEKVRVTLAIPSLIDRVRFHRCAPREGRGGGGMTPRPINVCMHVYKRTW